MMSQVGGGGLDEGGDSGTVESGRKKGRAAAAPNSYSPHLQVDTRCQLAAPQRVAALQLHPNRSHFPMYTYMSVWQRCSDCTGSRPSSVPLYM